MERQLNQGYKVHICCIKFATYLQYVISDVPKFESVGKLAEKLSMLQSLLMTFSAVLMIKCSEYVYCRINLF